ncbi:hypothetical protein KFK09_023943 [Dendrobium nobile]|uniref:NADH:ubiquinone reductase (non-electrogenic) n=1 Tax=Dendrobium nobile TaxID=94219 RepID=A0A8T3ACH4_DENNO|nr:hypothetical protein KFK09_023943 [Dendrobium nobile]
MNVWQESEDAQIIRRSVMNCFEKASLPNLSEEERKKNLHFVVIGGGPTSVKFTAELHVFVQEDLCKLYPNALELVKISLIGEGEHILTMFDKNITQFAEEKFKFDGIDVKTNLKLCFSNTCVMPISFQEYILSIFRVAGKDNSGTLIMKEIKDVLEDIERYPQNFLDLLKESEGDVVKESIELDIEIFKKALSQMDSQAAAQDGEYLAKCFIKKMFCEENPEGPLHIRGEGCHLFKPFSGEKSGAQLPGDCISIGHNRQWLWYSVYASKTDGLVDYPGWFIYPFMYLFWGPGVPHGWFVLAIY